MVDRMASQFNHVKFPPILLAYRYFPLAQSFTYLSLSTVELDIAQLCACLPTLKPFLRQYYPSLLRLNTFSGRSKERSTCHPAASSQHPSKTGRKWPGGSRDEELIGSNYLELGEDGKSDQSYVMSSMVVKEGK